MLASVSLRCMGSTLPHILAMGKCPTLAIKEKLLLTLTSHTEKEGGIKCWNARTIPPFEEEEEEEEALTMDPVISPTILLFSSSPVSALFF